MHILLLHRSHEGHTNTISQHLATVFEQHGHTPEVTALKDAPAFAGYDAVVLGASIHVGKFDNKLIDYVKVHKTQLEQRPNAFFSVCLRAAQHDAESQQIVQGYLDTLAAETGWQPAVAASFAGAMKYRDYNFVVRQMMKRIAKEGGLSTDTSQNHVYTDWDAVTAFAKDVINAFDAHLHKAASTSG